MLHFSKYQINVLKKVLKKLTKYLVCVNIDVDFLEGGMIMEEENRRFSWTNFFIKGIIIIIFVLFTVWLLSLSHKGINKSLDVLTDNIFSENIEKMKEVGQNYFTTERLPKKVGDIKTLSLAKMYDEKMILELKDKYGNACSAVNSYVSIEKFENEYHMKVFLECGEESDYIIVIMGCYDYCDTDICERQETTDVAKQIEYEYKKTTGGHWTDYGSWSEWSKVSVTKTDYRDVETKVEKEEYSYDKTIMETEYASFDLSCPSGYTKSSDGTKCSKTVTKVEYAVPKACDSTYNGYTLVSQDGFTCNYSKSVIVTANPTACPKTYDGYTLVSQDGFTCNYSKTISVPYTYTVTVPQTCYSQKVVISCSGCAPVVQNIPYDCSYTETRTGYKDETTTTSSTSLVSCPTGYSKSGNTCTKNSTQTTKLTASCPTGYAKTSDGTKCYKNVSSIENKDFVKSCPSGYDKTSDGTKCYKEVPSVVKVTGTRDVTYYRYRIREYVGGTVDYKWSTSKEDKSLLDAGYKLTGRTR